MRSFIGLLIAAVCGFKATGQERVHFDPKTSYSVFAAYSNDSSHMILGESENRRLFTVGVDYSRRIRGDSIYSWRYQVEVIPLELLQNPKLTTAVNYTLDENASSIGLSMGSFQTSSLEQRQCHPSSGSGNIYSLGKDGQEIPIGTESFTSNCSNPWTYGFGISPLGQKVNLLPRGRIQPYAAVNAGFVAFAGAVPSSNATMFNFTFEFGGGVEWNARRGQSWSLDYRCHHISNAGRGRENPGVDNGTLRLAYSFWR